MSESTCIFCEREPIADRELGACHICQDPVMRPITMEVCREMVAERGEVYFASYQSLGGGLSLEQYREALARFLYETNDIYIFGYCVRHDSRRDAMAAVQAWLWKHAPGESAARIFESVDSVDAYT